MATVDQPVGASEFTRLFDPAVRADPYPLYARLRAAGPSRLGTAPVVVLATYADCAAVLRDPRTSVDRTLATVAVNRLETRNRSRTDASASVLQTSFLFLDPPDHTRLRRLVSAAFTPRMIHRLESRIAALVDDAFDQAAERGALDVVADLAYPLPVAVICQMLGVPMADEPHFHRWSAVLARSLDPISAAVPDPQAELVAVAEAEEGLYRYFEDLIASRRTSPGDDLLSALIAVEAAGDTLTRQELIATCGLLLVAGHETTVNLIANGVLALLRHRPDALAALRTDPGLSSGVVEETLRYDPPVQLMPRVAREAMDIGRLHIDRGDILVLLLAAAQRDPAVFADPDRFDPQREPRHLAFGMGPHFCLGAPLARLEGRLALTRFAQRVHDPRLRVDPPPYKDNATLRGPAVLPVDFDHITIRSTPW